MLHYASLQCRETFVSNLYLRTFVLKEGIEKIHKVRLCRCCSFRESPRGISHPDPLLPLLQLIVQHYADPGNLTR